MDPAAEPPFEVVETAGGRLYRLPPRRLGPLRTLALAPLAAVAVAGTLLVNAYAGRIAKGQLNDAEWAGFILLVLTFTRGAYWLVSVAAVIWCGRGEIEVCADGRVISRDRAGWFRVRWARLKPGTARKLVLTELAPTKDAGGKSVVSSLALWLLVAETFRGSTLWLAVGYPRELLTPLADELARHLAVAPLQANPDERAAAPSPAEAVTEPVPIPVEVNSPQAPDRDLLDQPPDSRVAVERHADGVTLSVPPLGVWKANGGLILLGLIFSFLGGIATAASLAPLFQANPKWPSGAIIVGLNFLCLGVGFLVATVHAGRKRVVLAVVGDRLLTFESGPLGSRRREFARADLLDIAHGPSNVSVNNKPLPQLQIVPAEGRQVGLLTGRDDTELKWLATVLRQALGLPSEAPEYRTLPPPPARE